MKRTPLTRTGPLKRNARLRANPERPLQRTAKLQRGTGPTRKAPRRRNEAEKTAMKRWHDVVVAAGVCAACGSTDGPFEGHHVVKRRLLERLEQQRGLPAGTLAWDPDVGICLGSPSSPCRCHPRHDLAFKRIPRERLPARALRFAERLGPEGLRALDDYPVTPDQRGPLPA